MTMTLGSGQTLKGGQYLIEEIIRDGEFGISMKAQHVLLEQPVFIKTRLHKDASSFKQEIEILKALSNSHPSIVRVRDLFEENGSCYLVTDFIEGESLYSIVDRLKQSDKLLSQGLAIQYIKDIGEALTAVHSKGFIHRDVNPKNVIRQSNGRVVLIDFGLAVPLNAGTPASTQPYEEGTYTGNDGRVGYTKCFSPSEQISESGDDGKPTVDVYALAATLYFALTGKSPRDAKDIEIYNQALIPPNTHVPEISRHINQAILRGMNSEVSQRPQSISEWLKLLQERSDHLRPSAFNNRSWLPPLLRRRSTRQVVFVEQHSESGLDYRSLETFLSERKWKEADDITNQLILKILDREVEGWLLAEEIDMLPCDKFQDLDLLWTKYSRGRFGFSVQTKIWKDIGGNTEASQEIWEIFCRKTGWDASVPGINLGLSQNPIQSLRDHLFQRSNNHLVDTRNGYAFAASVLVAPIRICFEVLEVCGAAFAFTFFCAYILIAKITKAGYFPTTAFPGSGILVGEDSTLADGIVQIQEELVNSRQRTARGIAGMKRERQKYDKAKTEIKTWEQRAALCQQKGDIELEKQTRERIKGYTQNLARLQQQVDKASASVDLLKRELISRENKLSALKTLHLGWAIEAVAQKIKSCGMNLD